MASSAAAASSLTSLPSASTSTSLLARLHPSLYLSHHLAHSSRPSTSTKSSLDSPPIDINLSPLTTSSSRQPSSIPSPSSLIRYGSTTVICNITPTIVYPDAVSGSTLASTSAQSSTTLIPSISLTPLSSPTSDFKSGPPSEFAQNVTERLFSFLEDALPFDLSSLEIPTDAEEEEDGEGQSREKRVRAKWCLFADCSVIGFDGGLLEASFLAVITALRQLRLPKAHFSLDDNAVIASPKPDEYWRLRDHMTSVPMAFGFGIYNGHLLTTPSSFESSLVSSSILLALAFTPDTTSVTSVHSTGPLSASNVSPAQQPLEDEALLHKCIELALNAGKRTLQLLLQKEAEKDAR